jgi:hypothetical protein
MRLGTWPTKIVPGTLAERIYGDTEVTERHRHRYEFNMKYRERMTAKGFVISGTSPDGTLAELIELRDHPYFVGCQYHPEFQSKPNKPHALFKGFIAAALAYQAGDKKPVTIIEQAPMSVSNQEPVLQRSVSFNCSARRYRCDARSNRSIIAAPSPRDGTRSAMMRSRPSASSSRR